MTFHENVVIITGASKGIGREIALQLADQGAWLALAARSGDGLEAVAAECEERGGRALVVPTDVTDEAQCKNLIEQTVSHYGRIDTLVNNAGLAMWAMFEDLPDVSLIEHMMQLNFFSAVYCTFYALPYLKQSRGRIVAINSQAGKAGVPKHTGYAASKHAMVGFFDSLRVELMGTGVTVTLVHPGFVATGMHARQLQEDSQPMGDNPIDYTKVMSTKHCAQITIKAMEKRKRQDLMNLTGKAGQWVKLIAPGIVDNMAWKAVKTGT